MGLGLKAITAQNTVVPPPPFFPFLFNKLENIYIAKAEGRKRKEKNQQGKMLKGRVRRMVKGKRVED